MDFEVDFKVDLESPHARESKTVLASGFHAVDFRIPGTGFLIFFYWNLDFGFQLLVGFRIPKTRVSYSTSEISLISDSASKTSHMGL